MKKIGNLLFLLLALTLAAGAQNQYWTYQSQNFTTTPTSTVSIVHSNGNVYYFQADVNNLFLSVTEINPTFLSSYYSPSSSTSVSMSDFHQVSLYDQTSAYIYFIRAIDNRAHHSTSKVILP